MLSARSHPKTLPLALMVLVVLGGCMPEEVAIEGYQLYAGRRVENISFVTIDGATHVTFETRRALPTPKGPGAMDMWLVPLNGAQPARRFFEGRVDSVDGSVLGPLVQSGVPADESLRYWVTVNERQVTVGQRAVRIADRVLVDIKGRVLQREPGVSRFSVFDGAPHGEDPPTRHEWRMFQRPLPNFSGLAHHIRDDLGNERRLDDVTGPIHFYGNGFLYVGGAALTLYWVPNLLAPAEPLRSGVTRINFSPGGTRVIATVPLNGRPVDVLFDWARRTERQIPGSNICCQMELVGDVWIYAEARTAQAPARYHEFNLNTGAHLVIDLPPQMADLRTIKPRPHATSKLFIDSQNNYALYDPTADPPVVMLPLNIGHGQARFSRDGRYLMYVTLDSLVPVPEGRLMVQDVAFTAPPRQLSPPGTTMLLEHYFLLDDKGPPLVVFWARFGRAASDLYFAPLDGTSVDRVVEGIRNVDASRSKVTGIVRTSLQDLVGDLVVKTLDDGKEVVLARSVDRYKLVADAGTAKVKVVYLLRTRKAADIEGLWVTELPEL